MNCPKCGLINPDSAQRCDCGYDFESGKMKESHANAPTHCIRCGREMRDGADFCPFCGARGRKYYETMRTRGLVLFLAFRGTMVAVMLSGIGGPDSNMAVAVGVLLHLSGSAALLVGCWAETRLKNRSGALVLLVVLLDLLGLIILAVIPARKPAAVVAQGDSQKQT
jgi:hypothetical protein